VNETIKSDKNDFKKSEMSVPAKRKNAKRKK
jgi:hypothetical protein